jgi:hypothetical protein
MPRFFDRPEPTVAANQPKETRGMFRYNSPPNWPTPPAGWVPPEGWTPDASWGPAPAGWDFWIWEEPPVVPIPTAPTAVVPPLPAPMPIAYAEPPAQPARVRHTGRNIALVIVALALGLIVVGVVVAGLSSKSSTTKGATAAVATPTKSPVISTHAPSQTAAALSQTTSAPAAPLAPTSAAPASNGTSAVLFGATHGFVYTDGLVVSVLSATNFVPSSDAIGTSAASAGVLLSIRITNGTKASFDPSLSSVAVHAGTNGDQGDEIYQSGPPDLGSGFSGSIAPGQSATVPFGFDVPAGDLPNITVSVTPDFSHDDATFVGKVTP